MKVQVVNPNGERSEHEVSTFLEMRDLLSTDYHFANFVEHPTHVDYVLFYNEEEPMSSPANTIFPSFRGKVLIVPKRFDDKITYGHRIFSIQNIEWDTDSDDFELEDYCSPNLPVELSIECESEEHIADTLSDLYGFCIYSFEIKSMEIATHKH